MGNSIDNQAEKKARIAFLTVTPPPRTGQTTISEQMRLVFLEVALVHELKINKNGILAKRFWSIYKHASLVLGMLRIILGRQAYAAIYIVPDSGWGMLGSVGLAILARLRRIPLLAHHHVFSYCQKKSILATIFFYFASKKSLHIVLGNPMANGIQKHYGDRVRTTILSNKNFFKGSRPTSDAWPEEVKTIGYLSNITIAKGIEDFFDLTNSLSGRVKSVIAGPVYCEKLRAKVVDFVAQSPESRTYLGPVYEQSKDRFFDDIDILIFPTRYQNEAEPLVIYEALNRNIPVLSNDRGCISDQLPRCWISPTEAGFVAWAIPIIQNWKLTEAEQFIYTLAQQDDDNLRHSVELLLGKISAAKI